MKEFWDTQPVVHMHGRVANGISAIEAPLLISLAQRQLELSCREHTHMAIELALHASIASKVADSGPSANLHRC